MGQAWIATTPAGRPTLRKRLSLRRHLSRARNRRGAGPTLCRHIRHAASPGRDIPPCRQGRARCPTARSRRLAYNGQAPHTEQYHADLPPVACARTQPGREHLAISAQQLACQPRVDTYDAIIDAACEAWRKLIAQPQTITSIGMRDWAHVGQSQYWYNLARQLSTTNLVLPLACCGMAS